jgi:N-acetylmuramoyl-L-alanine amidase
MKRIALVFLAAFHPVQAAEERIFAIDPGHGGNQTSGSREALTSSSPNNARTPSGILEKDLTLEMSLEIASALERIGQESGQTVKVRLTRREDENPDFGERARRCLGEGPAPEAIVSIHFNASHGHNAHGSLGMVGGPKTNPDFESDSEFARVLSQASSRAIAEYLPAAIAREPMTDSHLHNGKGSYFFYQLQLIPELRGVPKCFLELEFIDRVDVEKTLIARKSETFPRIADAIARALLSLERPRPGSAEMEYIP